MEICISAPPADQEELLRIREHMIRRGPDGAGLWKSGDTAKRWQAAEDLEVSMSTFRRYVSTEKLKCIGNL